MLPEGEPRLESGSVSLQDAASAATNRLLIGCSYPAGQTSFRKKRQRNEAEYCKNNEIHLTLSKKYGTLNNTVRQIL